MTSAIIAVFTLAGLFAGCFAPAVAFLCASVVKRAAVGGHSWLEEPPLRAFLSRTLILLPVMCKFMSLNHKLTQHLVELQSMAAAADS